VLFCSALATANAAKSFYYLRQVTWTDSEVTKVDAANGWKTQKGCGTSDVELDLQCSGDEDDFNCAYLDNPEREVLSYTWDRGQEGCHFNFPSFEEWDCKDGVLTVTQYTESDCSGGSVVAPQKLGCDAQIRTDLSGEEYVKGFLAENVYCVELSDEDEEDVGLSGHLNKALRLGEDWGNQGYQSTVYFDLDEDCDDSEKVWSVSVEQNKCVPSDSNPSDPDSTDNTWTLSTCNGTFLDQRFYTKETCLEEDMIQYDADDADPDNTIDDYWDRTSVGTCSPIAGFSPTENRGGYVYMSTDCSDASLSAPSLLFLLSPIAYYF